MGNPEYGRSDDSEMIAAVNRAIDLGVTLFDTAPNYGFGGSEEVLGRALGPRRKDVVLVSKVGITWDPVTHTSKVDGRYSTLKRINEESLRRLGTDHLDLVLMHWPDPETPIAETMRALEELRAEGKTLHVGVSNFTAYEVREARRDAPVCANEVGYNLFDRRWEHEMFPTAQELGIGIMAYGPLAHGLLTGTLPRENAFDDRDWRRHGNIFGQRLFGPNLDANLNVVDKLLTVADRVATAGAGLGATQPGCFGGAQRLSNITRDRGKRRGPRRGTRQRGAHRNRSNNGGRSRANGRGARTASHGPCALDMLARRGGGTWKGTWGCNDH
jgi:aryl-alcohol dehydrogenase-like predicted oxidoreductase